MKKTIALLVAAVMLLSLTACGNNNSATQDTTPTVSFNAGTLEGILEGITADFSATSDLLNKEWASVRTTIGDTYEGYEKNQQVLLDWYDLVHSETAALYARTSERVIAYYKLVADTIDRKDDDAIDEATDEIYDVVYEDCFDDLYDVVYEDIYDDIYDEYYEGIIDDAEDSMEYGDWLDVRSDFYGTWLDVRSDFYGEWLDARSNFYGTWLDVRSSFRNGNFDIDDITAEKKPVAENGKDDETAPPTAEGDPSLDATPVDGKEYTTEDFRYIILTDGTIEITKYTGTDSDVTISSSYDGYDVSRIGAFAFEGCTTVEEIIMWPDVIFIGEAAFKGCTELEEFSIPSSVTVINDSVFENCTNLESIIIWGDVSSIGEAAFKNCASLEEVSIPSSCLLIGKSAFEGCANLEDVIFWGGEVIGDRAFKGCTSLEDISIPSEVTAIGESAFEGCTSLESVIIWGNDVTFGVNAFANCPKLNELPDGAYNDGTVDAGDSSGDNGNDNADTTGIRPEFKKAMDEYEAFFDEYVAFMIAFKESDNAAGMMGEYNSMMMQYVETMAALDDIDESELSDEEALYYAEVMLRINQKLLGAM